MKNLIFSTCGTSILTNNADDVLRPLFIQHANVKNAADISLSEERGYICAHIEERKKRFVNYSYQEAKKYSAEINGILSFYGGQLTKENKHDIHYLLATDTWLGEETANIVKLWLEANGFTDIRVYRHVDLQTSDLQAFRVSLANLVKWCDENIKPQRTEHCRVIFNLSGGFKSETGFLQMLGMFYADETIYIFERSNELMRIPHLPIKMDDEESIQKDLHDFRRAALNLDVHSEKYGIYWFEIDGMYSLTEWGELIFAHYKAEIYQKQIYPAPSEKIIFSPPFLNSCDNETAANKREINEKIDLFARFLENAKHPNPYSLHYHPVTHPHDDRVTHEFYAYSNNGAKRIYCHSLDEGKVELLFLGKHL
ncbi:MAG: putative CRISPR-associated protein [Campylobacteraceae bacterium]|jgi:putative CRISPR-associated protein (TIGR02619 family)|nr:putative CRISPR-associated protein [Campylobacteraceae bacterium]